MAFADWSTHWAMGTPETCGPVLDAYARAWSHIQEDAEMQFVTDLMGPICGTEVRAAKQVPYSVRIDSDVPIGTVDLNCGGSRLSERVGGDDTIARFESAIPLSLIHI